MPSPKYIYQGGRPKCRGTEAGNSTERTIALDAHFRMSRIYMLITMSSGRMRNLLYRLLSGLSVSYKVTMLRIAPRLGVRLHMSMGLCSQAPPSRNSLKANEWPSATASLFLVSTTSQMQPIASNHMMDGLTFGEDHLSSSYVLLFEALTPTRTQAWYSHNSISRRW